MGWKKSKKIYDSLSGHGQTYLKSCGKGERPAKKVANNITPDVPVMAHHCPWNHKGRSSKGMEAKAALECVNKVWLHEQISTFIRVVYIDDDATTKAYLSHSFADLDAKELTCPTNSKGGPKISTRDNKGQASKGRPSHNVFSRLMPPNPIFC
jgi:hypothetical protein